MGQVLSPFALFKQECDKKDRHGVTSRAESPSKLEVRKEENWGIKKKCGPMALLVFKV